MKIKNRISFFNTLSVAITTVLVFFVIYFIVDKTAYSHLDNDILLEKEEIFKKLDSHNNQIIINKMDEWDEAEHNKIEVNPTFLQIVDLKGHVIYHSANLLNGQFLFNPKNTRESFYNSEINQQKIRLGQFPIINKNGKILGQLTIAVSQKELFLILNNLLLVLLISFPLMIFIQYIASSVAASKAIKPVYKLIKTTSEINESNIGIRLVLPERKDELYKLTKTINELLERVEKSFLQQKQFTSDASHEIRTPLAAIRGTLEVLIRKQREPKVYNEKIIDIISQVDRLDVLLDQLLQIARIESGAFIEKKETIQLSKFMKERYPKWKFEADLKNIAINFKIEENASIIGSNFFLELIVDNLVSNAIKYGKESGSIYLIWDSTLKMLSVNDDGIGISKEQLPNIFNRFYRTEASRSTTVKGNGLGLSIVKKLADLQGIKLSVKSTLGKGSAFTLQF